MKKPRIWSSLLTLLIASGAACSGNIDTGSMSTTPPVEPSGQPGGPADPMTPSTSPPSAPTGQRRGVEGILDCPTVPLPAYGKTFVSSLSLPFRRNCAACHGSVGEGNAKYPPIPGKLTKEAYIAKVRAGVNAMPAFSVDFVSDAQLSADFDNLKKLAGQSGGLAQVANGPDTWTDAQVEEIYRTGLAVWRKPGSVDQQACTNCHSPDGVELAIIGFTDDAILRRGQQHLSPEDALTVRDFIHAQRRRLGIAKVCATDWRPFQPGGTVLPGANKTEQDAAFLEVLRRRKLLVATGKVVTLEDARRALEEIQTVDLRTLPIGIPLPRWSEDKFNGPDHRDINDYMAPVPTVPNRPSEYFAIEDEYLARPTDAGLYRLLDENRRNMNDQGYTQQNSVPRIPASNCHYPTSTSWISERITKPKRLGVLVAAHLFREEIKNPGSYLRRPAAPFPDAPAPVNPAFTLGAFAIEPPCYDHLNYPTWIKSFPASFRDEMPEDDLKRGVVENATDRITHVWMTLGQILDPTLISTDDMQSNKIHYWAFRNFTQNEVHLPFMYVHRMATQTKYWGQMRGTTLFPKVSGPFDEAGRDWLHPLLATEHQESAGLQSVVPLEGKILRSAEANQFKGNLIRMLMLLRRDLLQKGAVLQEDQNFDHCLATTCQTGQMKGFVDGLRAQVSTPAARAALTAQGFDVDLYETDTRRLIGEVLDLMAKAPKRK
jgi:hypothetical protein